MDKKMISIGFTSKLKKLRHDRGWSQGQLAKKLNVNTQNISKYERGVITPPTDMMVKIASIYDVSLDYLLRNESNTAASKIKNQTLLRKIEEIDNLSEDDQRVLTILLDAFIKKRKFEAMIGSSKQEEELLYKA